MRLGASPPPCTSNMDDVLRSIGATAVKADELERQVIAKAGPRDLEGISTKATSSVIAQVLEQAEGRLRANKPSSGLRQQATTPSRQDALEGTVAILRRVLQASRQQDSDQDTFMGVLGQADAVRLGKLTPSEAAALAKQKRSNRKSTESEQVESVSGAPIATSDSLLAPAAVPPSRPPTPPSNAAKAHATRATASPPPVHDLLEMEQGSLPAPRRSGKRPQASPLKIRAAPVSSRSSGIPDDFNTAAFLARLEQQPEHQSYTRLPGSLRLPTSIVEKLLPYQVTGLRWLCELHSQRVGGIIADEMGLGKTVQVACLLGALQASHWTGVNMVVCPATMLGHWYRELTKWCPALRVLVLHEGSVAVRRGASQKELLAAAFDRSFSPPVNVVLLTYSAVRADALSLGRLPWGYVILDEGHSIRNPDANVTKAIKALNTVHRIVVTGAPIQNKLMELWSLFDFVFPGRLGTQETFAKQFSGPIVAGTWAKASALQSMTAHQLAVKLRELVQPYLLRRVKKDVSTQLPPKSEKVIFTKLTSAQMALYRSFLASPALLAVLDGSTRSFRALGMLQKLCNHPGLFEDKQLQEEGAIGTPDRGGLEDGVPFTGSESSRKRLGATAWRESGKMVAAVSIVRAWLEAGHRVLWFCQGREMLDVVEGYAAHEAGWTYMRMDGTTAVSRRQTMVDTFNHDQSVQVFLLTTRVGGLGVNLTGADRVLLFDPAWNPSVDAQARERAWRIGQTRPVVVYRLISAGTIEEKVYERQVFKQVLMSRVLGKAASSRTVEQSHLRELFTLVEPNGVVSAPSSASSFTPLTAVPRSARPGGREARVQGVAVRVEAYDSDGERELAPLDDPVDGTGGEHSKSEEASLFAALMDGAGLETAFASKKLQSLSESDKRAIADAAEAAAAAAVASMPASARSRKRRIELPHAPKPAVQPSYPSGPAFTQPVLPTEVTPAPEGPFGRYRTRCLNPPHTHPTCTQPAGAIPGYPGAVRGGFLLGLPPGAVSSSGPADRHGDFELGHTPHPASTSSPAPPPVPLQSSSVLLARFRASKPVQHAQRVGGAPTDASGRSWSGALGRMPAQQKPPEQSSSPPSSSVSDSAVARMSARLVAILTAAGRRSNWQRGLSTAKLKAKYGQDEVADVAVFASVLRSVASFDAGSRQWSLRRKFRPAGSTS